MAQIYTRTQLLEFLLKLSTAIDDQDLCAFQDLKQANDHIISQIVPISDLNEIYISLLKKACELYLS